MQSLIRGAAEFSKKLTIIDIVVYVVLLVGCLTVLIIKPELAEFLVEIIAYITTAYVALRGSYTIKAAIENFTKIKNSVKNNYNEYYINFEEEDG